MKTYQVVGVGNALVDIIALKDDAFLKTHGIEKGAMQLIDAPRARALFDSVGATAAVSGGSAANTIAGIARLGGRTAYIGKIKDDVLGDIFTADLSELGIGYATRRASSENVHGTGQCVVIVSQDGERSMNTYLGVTKFLSPTDIDPAIICESEWLYLEGYRFDGDDSHKAFAKAIALCAQAGGKVALTLSDPLCVERHRDAFNTIIKVDVDLLFCNRAELLSLCQQDDFEKARTYLAEQVDILACTDAENGAYIHTRAGARVWHVPAEKLNIVDATGAGDLFAAGFLWGLIEGYDLDICARVGCQVAGETLMQIGARPKADLYDILARKGVIPSSPRAL